MNNLRHISGERIYAADEPVPDVVKMLESLLKEAQSGRIQALAIGAISKDGGHMTSVAGPSTSLQIVGVSTILLHKVLAMTDKPQR